MKEKQILFGVNLLIYIFLKHLVCNYRSHVMLRHSYCNSYMRRTCTI